MPALIVGYFNLITEQGQFNLELAGWIIGVVVIYLTIIRKLNRTTKEWAIQNRNKMFVVNYRYFQGVLFVGILFWLWKAIEVNYERIWDTLFFVLVSMVIGWIFRFFSLMLEYKQKKDPSK